MTTKKEDRKTQTMTADVDLLPLPAIDSIVKYVEDYARACIAHATSAKDAEIEALRADLADYMQIANDEAEARNEDADRLDWLASEALQLWGIRDRGWYELPYINIQSGRECCDPADLRAAIDEARGVDAVADKGN